MGLTASKDEVAKSIASYGLPYSKVCELVIRFNLSGPDLVSCEPSEVTDFLLSRCPSLGSIERRRLLWELDCLQRKQSSEEPLYSLKEQWSPAGPHVGRGVQHEIWDDTGQRRHRARGKVVAYCSPGNSTFVKGGKVAALWRAQFDGVSDLVEMEAHEVDLAVRSYEASKTKPRKKVKLTFNSKPCFEFVLMTDAYPHDAKRKRKSCCKGCGSSPCARSSAGCFVGVTFAHGRFLASDGSRFATPQEAARRHDMLCHKRVNFDYDDAQRQFEQSFRVVSDSDDDDAMSDASSNVAPVTVDHDAPILLLKKSESKRDDGPSSDVCHAKSPKTKLKRATRVLLDTPSS